MARKVSNIHYIYKTTCNVTGRWYVGMHSTSNENDGYLGSGTILRRSIRKYGADNHTKEILEYCNTRDNLSLREVEIVTKELISDGFCMNLKQGGEGGWDENHSKAFKKKLDNDQEFREKFSKKCSKISKEKILNGIVTPINEVYDWNGKTHAEETKQLISDTKKGTGTGEANSQYGTCWMTKDGLNKKVKKEELESHLYDGWITGRK